MMQLDQLGPYRIVGELGRGGMGTVFEGVNLETGDPAAVKLLAATLAGEEGFRDRFVAEIETLRKLNHPGIVRLFGFGEQGPHLFYAMELVDGNSLEEELTRGRRFEWREVTRIGIEVCQSLRHAHDRGVVHRDLKPGNLLLGPDGRVKLSDFGIARLFGNTRMTQAGSILGTAEYMAPEQAEGRPVDARADLYSLGAVMYALLARRPVFAAKSLAEMLHKQRYEPPEPLRRFNSDCPDELVKIVMQLLEKEPEKRPASAAALARRLTAMQQELSQTPETLLDPLDRQFAGPLAEEGGPSSVPPPLPSTRLVGATGSEQPAAAEPPSAPPLASAEAAEPLPETKATAAFAQAAVAAPDAQQPAAPQPTGHFIAIDRSQLDPRHAEPDESRVWVSPWTIALAGALAAVGLVIWWLLQPPSAETLVGRVERRYDGSPASLAGCEAEINELLMRFPKHEQAGKFREYQREVELYRLERRFDRRAKGLGGGDSLLPVERAYLEAINHARLDPDVGIVKLQAVIELFDRHAEAGGPTGLCLELARRRVEQLRAEQQRVMADLLVSLEEELAAAERLRTSDAARAQAIYRAVIELYGGKPWAAAAVERAQSGLEAIGDGK